MEKVRGGARENAGRKSKSDEQKLIEKLSPLESKAFTALEEALDEKKDWAVKLFFNYMFGMPKQIVDQTSNISLNNFSLKDVISFDKTKQ